MVGSASRCTEVLPTVLGQQGPRAAPEEMYTTSRMQVAHIPEDSSCEVTLTQANQSSLANLNCQNTVPNSQLL